MYLTAAGNRCRLTSPATLLPLVLLLEPLLQGLEVLEQRAPVHLPLSRHRLERVRPGLARAHRQHLLEPCSRLLAPVEGALVQRPFVTRRLAHGAMELELQEPGEEVPRVGHVRGHVVLRGRIEVLLGARERRRYALVFAAQRPPRLVV